MKKLFIVFLILALIIIKITVFWVDETEYGIVLRFGKFQKEIIEPGLNFKLPDPIETVTYFDNRILDYDSQPDPDGVITKDKKTIIVDNYAKWQVVDPLQFYKTVRNERGMYQRLDEDVYSALREALGKYDFIDIVSSKRETIMADVTEKSNEKAEAYGIKIVDVRIKRADLAKENEDSVYANMKAERERIAQEYRAEGQEIKDKMLAGVDREVREMKAEANRKAKEIIGDAEKQAIRIYNETYSKDIEFFDFIQRIELIESSLDKNSKLIMTTESDLFKILNSPK